eukprot:jgi/Tetstr1/461415/TSEL_006525.t1
MRAARFLRTFEELQPPGGGGAMDSPFSRQISPGTRRLRVLQFNVLADGLAQHGKFVKTPPEALEWEFRAPLLLQEVLSSKPDVICLQEVNRYGDSFQPKLEAAGYRGVFAPKIPSPAERYGYPGDGCCIFYSLDRLAPVAEPISRRYLDEGGQSTSQGFLAWPLRDRATESTMLIATTHLKAKLPGEAIRCQQAKQLMEQLKEIQADLVATGHLNGAKPPGNTSPCHMVLTGDFNTTEESEVFQSLRDVGLQSLWDYKPTKGASTNFTTWKFRPVDDGSIRDVKRVLDRPDRCTAMGSPIL